MKKFIHKSLDFSVATRQYPIEFDIVLDAPSVVTLRGLSGSRRKRYGM